MIGKEHILKALKKLRDNKKRKFDQSVDLLINLTDYDPKRTPLNTSLNLPHPAKKKKICAFLDNPNSIFDKVITKKEFDVLTEANIKKLVQEYDFFVSLGKFMPDLAKKFGRTLGPSGKMPDPKMGCVLMAEDEEAMKKLAVTLQKIIKIRAKEKSIKTMIGKESMKDEDLSENAAAIFIAVHNALPKKKENIKNVMVKYTMTKPVKVVEEEKK